MLNDNMPIGSMIEYLNQNFDVIGVIDCDSYNNNWIDLYLDIKNLYKTEYKSSQRIVITSSFDYYRDSTHGIILQSLQNIINDLEIPNFFICFITTNKNIIQEYDFVFKNYNQDSNPISLYIASGDFLKKDTTDVSPYYKLKQPTTDNLQVFKNLTKEEKDLLFKNKNFCIVPWISMMISPNGNVRPCCFYQDKAVGNSRTQDLKEIWNSSEYKKIRTQMLSNQPLNGCKSCYEAEKYNTDSFRNSANREFVNHVKKVKTTRKDGSLNFFELVYVDSRFNNLCNLGCLMCDENSSTSWHAAGIKMGLINSNGQILNAANKQKGSLVKQIIDHVDTIEKIYFAGGEPLIIEEFYQILEFLDKNKKHDVRLVFNTNLTKSFIKNRDIFEYWKNFKNISVYASLDGSEDRASYLRPGSDWEEIVNFRKKIIEKRPDIDFVVSATLTILNCLHIVDFHREWVTNGLISPENFNLGLLESPKYLNVSFAPTELKNKIQKKYIEHLEWLKPNDALGRATYGFESAISFIKNNNETFDKDAFWKNIKIFDNYYKNDLLKTFPELIDLL